MNVLTNRQIGVVISLSIISLKLFIFPSLLSTYSQNNSYISVFISLAIEFMFILLILWIMKKNPTKSLFEILESRLGKVFPKIIAAVLTIFFLGKALVATKEIQNFLVQLLFEHISWWKFALPLLVLIVYILNKSFRTFARSVQFFYLFIFAGATITLILPIQEVRFVNLLPIMADGFSPIIKGVFHTSFHFIDFFVLLILMGRVKYSKSTAKSVIKYTLFTYAFVLIFFIVYVGLFGTIVVNEGLLVSDIPLYSNFPATNGRLEWLSLIVWSIVLVYQASLMLMCARESLSYTTNIKNNSILTVIICISIGIALYMAYLDYAGILKFITSNAFNISLLSFIVVLMICLIICSVGRRKYGVISKKNR